MDSLKLEATSADDGRAGAELINVLEEGRKRFLSLVDHIRPELHRYCARMTGTVADGEDVVQETLARACFELSQMQQLPPLRPWLFRIAHNLAIDHWRHERYRMSEPLDAASDIAEDEKYEPDNVMARNQAVRSAISCFLKLAPAQRACVILKDVLDHSIVEVAVELNLSVPSVKAALHRGRAALQHLTETSTPSPKASSFSPALGRYARLFNARDWDGVRAMLADDVKLDLVSQRKAAGRREVSNYFSNYGRTPDWRVTPAWLADREVLAVLPDSLAKKATYFIELSWRDHLVLGIRDFRYVRYILQEGLPEPVRTG